MPFPALAIAAAKFAPAIIGGLSALFGKKKQGVPEYLKPYIDQYMQNVVGGYDKLIADANDRDPGYKALRQEALAAFGKGKYAGAGGGPISQQVLSNLAARQATDKKASDREVGMNYAAAGINSGLLPAVKAQMDNERTQSNELANASAQSNVAINSVNSFQNERRARQDLIAKLTAARGDAYGNVLNIAARTGGQDAPPSALQRILSGVAGASPAILGGLGGDNASVPSNASDVISKIPLPTINPDVGVPKLPSISNDALSALPDISKQSLPQPYVPTVPSIVPTSYGDWFKKYGKMSKAYQT